MMKKMLVMFFVVIGFAHEAGAMNYKMDKKYVQRWLNELRRKSELQKRVMIASVLHLNLEVRSSRFEWEKLSQDEIKTWDDHSRIIQQQNEVLYKKFTALKLKSEALEKESQDDEMTSLTKHENILSDEKLLQQETHDFEKEKRSSEKSHEERATYIENTFAGKRELLKYEQWERLSSRDIKQVFHIHKMNRE